MVRFVVVQAALEGGGSFGGLAGGLSDGLAGSGARTAAALRVPNAHKSAGGSPYPAARGVFLVFAIADHPWVDSANGAAVRIAMTVGARSSDTANTTPSAHDGASNATPPARWCSEFGVGSRFRTIVQPERETSNEIGL